MDLYFVSSVLFMAILAVIFVKDRKNVKRESILFLRRTQRGKKSLIRIAKRFSGFWKILGNVAIIIGFIGSIYAVIIFVDTINLLLTTEIPKEGAGILIPTPTKDPILGRGFVALPFWYWITIVFVLVIVHEGLHAIMGVIAKVKIKSLGWGLLLILPLAFVEPDERQVLKKPAMEQLRFYAAGSFGNLLVAFIIMAAFFPLFNGFSSPVGVGNYGLMEGFPAQEVNLSGIIVQIENYTIKTREDLAVALDDIGPGKRIMIKTMKVADGGKEFRTFMLTTVKPPENETDDMERGFIGIGFSRGPFGIQDTIYELKPEYKPYESYIEFFGGLFFWMWLVNLFVGLFNLLPIRVLDGERMWFVVLQKITPKRARKIMNAVSYLTLFMLFTFFFLVLI